MRALTDVSATDANFSQACAAAWMCTRVPLHFCEQYLFVETHLRGIFVRLCNNSLWVAVLSQSASFSTLNWSQLDLWLLSKSRNDDDALREI